MSGNVRTRHLDDQRAVRVLSSPLRMEILQAMDPREPVTVGDLARRLGRERASLYYHMKKLVEIGVVSEVDRRLSGKRYESLYAPTMDRLELGADVSSSAGRRAIEKLVLSMLRQTGREFQEALDSGRLEQEGLETGRRISAWLTSKDLEELRRLVGRIETLCTRRTPHGKAKPYAVTHLVIPLDDEPQVD